MTRRGQLVLVGAVLVAVAVVALVLASLQLGYHADVRASVAHDDPAADARSVLDRAVYEASAGVPGTYEWTRRRAAVDAVESRLGPRLRTVERARLEEGIHRDLSYNGTLAERWRRANCPRGPHRQFGTCEAIDGVVVQERDGWTHVLAVAFDVEATAERERTELSTVVRPVG